MEEQPQNNSEPAKEGTNTNPQNTGASNPAPKEIKVKVDLKQKPIQEDEKVTVQSDDDFFKDVTQPTEKDISNDQVQKAKLDALKNKLAGNPSPPSSSTEPSPSISPDKRKQQAEKWVKALDILNKWGCKAFSGQADNIGFDTPTQDKKDLAEALADVMEEYNWNPAPLLTLAITFGAVYGTPWMNAFESRKKIKDLRGGKKREEIQGRVPNLKPEFDAEKGEHRKKRGGQFKA